MIDTYKHENWRYISYPYYFKNILMLLVDFGAMHRFRFGQVYPLGTAHFIEHLLSNSLQKELREKGILVEAKTSWEYTSYSFYFANQPYDVLNNILKCFEKFSVTEEEVNNEREIIKKELNKYAYGSQNTVYSQFLQRVFPNSPFGYDIVGTSQSLEEINNEIIQRAYLNFYLNGHSDKYYTTTFVPPSIKTFEKRNKVIMSDLSKEESMFDSYKSKNQNFIAFSNNKRMFIIGFLFKKNFDYIDYLINSYIYQYHLIKMFSEYLLTNGVISDKLKTRNLYTREFFLLTVFGESKNLEKAIDEIMEAGVWVQKYINLSMVDKIKLNLKNTYLKLLDSPHDFIDLLAKRDFYKAETKDIFDSISTLSYEYIFKLIEYLNLNLLDKNSAIVLE